MKEKLEQYIKEKGVIAINGSFGIGKTTFIDNYIKWDQESIFIKFNAWEFDFADNPKAAFLLSVYKDIVSTSENKEKAKELAIQGFKVIKTLIKNGLRHKGISMDGVKTTIEEGFDNVISMKNLIDQIRENINKICDLSEKNMVLIIDDLDRARPDFSLEIFEIAKHIFSVEKLSVILVFNKDTMNEIIRLRFGEIKGEEYLSKFLDRTIDFEQEPLHELLLFKNYDISETHIIYIIFQELNFHFPISWRSLAKVRKNYEFSGILTIIRQIGLFNLNDKSFAILCSIFFFFKLFKDTSPFEEKNDGKRKYIKIKEKFKYSIASCLREKWFTKLEEVLESNIFKTLNLLIENKEMIQNDLYYNINEMNKILEENTKK